MTYPFLHSNNTHNSSAPILVLFIAGGKDLNLIGYRGCLTTPFWTLLKIDQGKPLNQTKIDMNVNSEKTTSWLRSGWWILQRWWCRGIRGIRWSIWRAFGDENEKYTIFTYRLDRIEIFGVMMILSYVYSIWLYILSSKNVIVSLWIVIWYVMIVLMRMRDIGNAVIQNSYFTPHWNLTMVHLALSGLKSTCTGQKSELLRFLISSSPLGKMRCSRTIGTSMTHYEIFCSTCGGMCFLAATHRENGYIPDKYPLYKVYMGLITKGTTSQGAYHHFPYDTVIRRHGHDIATKMGPYKRI